MLSFGNLRSILCINRDDRSMTLTLSLTRLPMEGVWLLEVEGPVNLAFEIANLNTERTKPSCVRSNRRKRKKKSSDWGERDFPAILSQHRLSCLHTIFIRNVRTDRDVSPSQGFGACASMADKISQRSWRQYRLSALRSPFPVRDYYDTMSSRALRTRTPVSSRSLLKKSLNFSEALTSMVRIDSRIIARIWMRKT